MKKKRFFSIGLIVLVMSMYMAYESLQASRTEQRLVARIEKTRENETALKSTSRGKMGRDSDDGSEHSSSKSSSYVK